MIEVETLGDPRNIVLDMSSDFPHGFNAAFAKLLGHLFDLRCVVFVNDRMLLGESRSSFVSCSSVV